MCQSNVNSSLRGYSYSSIYVSITNVLCVTHYTGGEGRQRAASPGGEACHRFASPGDINKHDSISKVGIHIIKLYIL